MWTSIKKIIKTPRCAMCSLMSRLLCAVGLSICFQLFVRNFRLLTWHFLVLYHEWLHHTFVAMCVMLYLVTLTHYYWSLWNSQFRRMEFNTQKFGLELNLIFIFHFFIDNSWLSTFFIGTYKITASKIALSSLKFLHFYLIATKSFIS